MGIASPNSMPSRRRIALAFLVAITADAIQLPLTAGMIFGVTLPPLLVSDVIIDIVAMILVVRLIGFHWVLLPGFILEAIPGLDLAPTWTGCVAFALWRRKQSSISNDSPSNPSTDSGHSQAIDVGPSSP